MNVFQQSGHPSTPILLTIKEAAAALRISEKTLYSISTPRGSLRAVRIHGRVLYSPSDLEAYIEEQKGTPNEA